MQEYVKSEFAKVVRRFKEFKQSAQETEPIITDIKEDIKLLKQMQKKLSEAIDVISSVASDMKVAKLKMEQNSPRNGMMDTA